MDDTAEINFGKFQDLIDEYESLIKNLTLEVDYYRSEHNACKSQIGLLVTENSELSTKLKEALKPIDNSSIEHKYTDDDVIRNLKNQLETLSKEKESVVQLWQSGLQTIDYLEEELKLFEGRTHGYVPKQELTKVKTNYDELLKKEEIKLKTLQDRIGKFEGVISQKNAELEQLSGTYKDALKTIQALESDLKKAQEKCLAVEKEKYVLEIDFKAKQKEIEALKLQEQYSKEKVMEAINVVEFALMEKDAALLREAKAKEEVASISKILTTLKEETGDRILNEVNAVKSEYNEKLKLLKTELYNSQSEVKNKSFELEKCMLKYEALQRETTILQKGNVQVDESSMSKLLVLEKNLESTFQKLLLSEKKNMQLTSERDNIKSDLEQMAEHFKRDVMTREVEKQSLQHKIASSQKEIETIHLQLVQTTQKLNYFKESNIEIAKKSRLQKIMFQESIVKKDHRLKSLASHVGELLEHLQLQIGMKEKWKNEARMIFDKCSKRIQELKTEISEERNIKNELNEHLMNVVNELYKYEEIVKNICEGFKNIVPHGS